MVKSAYIHIPFCKSKCNYCSFISFCDLTSKQDYLNALAKEFDSYYEGENLETVYIGGGTPSVLEIKDLSRILRKFKTESHSEITMEINPDDVNYDYLRELFDLGINRLSFGCQTFDDSILKLINRRHNSSQVKSALFTAKNAGFRNLSLDFIYGLPTQTQQGFIDDLKKAVELGVQHISLYGLKIEEGCYFYNHLPENLPDEDMQADMYLEAISTLCALGFEHYEVSNFSREGFNSKHNLTYWNNEEYYGFGVASHGYKNGVRYANTENLNEYIKNPLEHKDSKLLTTQERLEEEIFLGFRKMKGINVSQINIKYGIDFETKYSKIIQKYEGLKLLERTEKGYKLTPNGVLVSNVILADFI
jgi:oxygen-independent coproporphyrinogen-3 oxidase